jgi:hypothetical protein
MVEVKSVAGLEIVGKAEKVWDLDWIAVIEKIETARTKKCGGYEKVKGDIEVIQVDSAVKIYDRRSGKVLHEKTFRPKNECPSFAMVSGDKKAKAYVLPSDIQPWVRGALSKGP